MAKDINEEIKKYDNVRYFTLKGGIKEKPFIENSFINDKDIKSGIKSAKYLFRRNNKE